VKRRILLAAILLLGWSDMLAGSGGELRFCLNSEPKTFNPLLVNDDASETIRYMTGGVLLRVNRLTEQPESELATAWKVTDGGRRIRFKLRQGIRYSDGTPFSSGAPLDHGRCVSLGRRQSEHPNHSASHGGNHISCASGEPGQFV